MATATIHLVNSIDGKSTTLWPVNAISRDANGVFKDIRGRVVKAPADRLGAAMDSAQPAKRKPVANDRSTEDTLIRRLLPMLKRMADEAATAEDDADAEQEALFGGSAEDEALEAAGIVNVSEQSKTRLQWLEINKRNAERRGLPYSAIVPASREQARKAH